MKKIAIFLAFSSILFGYSSEPKEETATAPGYILEYNAGIKAQKNKQYAKAVQHYRNALDEKSDFAEAWNNLGYSYRMIAKSYLTLAGNAYDKAVDYDPKLEDALEYQGEYFVMMGKLKNAYKNYQKLKQTGSSEAKELKRKLDAVLNEAESVLKEYSP